MKDIAKCNKNAFYPTITEQTQMLPLYCCGVGINPLQEERIRPEGFPKHHLFLVLQGRGRLYCEGQEIEVKEGSCFLIEKGVPHRYLAEESVFQTGWLTFDGFGCEKLFAYVGVNRFCFQPCPDPDLEQLFREFYRKLQNHVSEPEMAVLLYDYLHRFLGHLVKTPSDKKKSLDRAAEYIRSHYEKDLTLDEIASVCEMSSSAFCRRFKEIFRETPFEYVQKIRIGAAKKLLVEQPTFSIQQVGERTGFHDAGYFCRTFRKLEGMSPGSFRKMA